MNRIYYLTEPTSIDKFKEFKRLYSNNPMSLLEVNRDDAENITKKIVNFLVDYTLTSKTNGYVVGLSGGIDSSISAILATKAVGPDFVFGMLLPSKFTSQDHIDDALMIAKQCGIEVNNFEIVRNNFDKVIDLTMSMTEIDENHSNYKILLGNNHARERMKILRGKAASSNRLVLGTTNLTEAWLGYATIAGDGYKGIDIEPIQRLPKTSERLYAKYLGIPEQIITKAPTAGLWEGQTDEGEIGMSYENIDLVMTGWMLGFRAEEIEDINKNPLINKDTINKVVSQSIRNNFKSMPEPYPRLK